MSIQDADTKRDTKRNKKRKRDALPNEIEIDVNLPEPVSKKAARKAKKLKINPTPEKYQDRLKEDGIEATGTNEEKDQPGKRSEYGVWIGNLPWSATKDSLRKFLLENSEIENEGITRIHLPPPTKPPNPNWTAKPLNKGFAYVDLSTELAMYSAIALTEIKMDGRALLIKNAKSFEGRPEKSKAEGDHDDSRGKGSHKQGNPPNKRVFVGNLSFDITKEDLEAHYAQCGTIEQIHMATFEDTNKCKGYAWVTFDHVEAATSAVKGYVLKSGTDFKGNKKGADHVTDDDDEEDSKVATKKNAKPRKWYINKVFGRELRTEFAEDSTTRYNKRFGKDKPHKEVEGVNPERWKNFTKDRNSGGDRADSGDGGFKQRKVDPRTIRSGAAHSSAPRASQAIVASQGKKVVFD